MVGKGGNGFRGVKIRALVMDHNIFPSTINLYLDF